MSNMSNRDTGENSCLFVCRRIEAVIFTALLAFFFSVEAQRSSRYSVVADTKLSLNFSPMSVAYDSQHGTLFVYDYAGKCIKAFSGNGSLIATVCRTAGFVSFYEVNSLVWDESTRSLLTYDRGQVFKVSTASWSATVHCSGGYGTAVGPCTTARFDDPTAMAINPSTRELFLVDYDNRRLCRMFNGNVDCPASWTGYFGFGLAIESNSGTLFVADIPGNCIRSYANSSFAATVVGGTCSPSNNPPAPSPSTPRPIVYVGGSLGILVVADVGANRVFGIGWLTPPSSEVALAGGTAGMKDGIAPLFNKPCSLALVGGDILVADRSNQKVRRLRFHSFSVSSSTARTATYDSLSAARTATYDSLSAARTATYDSLSAARTSTYTRYPSLSVSSSAARTSTYTRYPSLSVSSSAGRTSTYTRYSSLSVSSSAGRTSTYTRYPSLSVSSSAARTATYTKTSWTQSLPTFSRRLETMTPTNSVLCAVELCKLSAPPHSRSSDTIYATPTFITAVHLESVLDSSFTAMPLPYSVVTNGTMLKLFVDCPGYTLPLHPRDVDWLSSTRALLSSALLHGSVTEITLWSQTSLPLGTQSSWLPADTLPYRAGNSIDIQLSIDCSGLQRIRLTIPILPLKLPEIALVAERVGSGLQWTSSVGGASSASSVGRVAASRRVLLCSIAAASSGGLLGLSIAHDADDDDGTTAFARGTIVGNTVVLLCAAACLGIAAVVYTHYTLSGSYRVGLVRMALPSSLLPVWTALVQGVASAVPLVAVSDVAGDAGYGFLGAVVVLLPVGLLVAAAKRAAEFYFCCARTPAAVRAPTAERGVGSVKCTGRTARVRLLVTYLRTKFRRSFEWCQADGSPLPPDSRLMWVLLIEFRVLHYAVLDAAVLILASVLGSLAGLGSLLQCRVVAGLTMTLYVAQLLVCVTVRPYAVPLFGWYAVVCLVCNCVNLAVQLASLSTGVNASPSSTVLLVTTSLELLIFGLSLGRQVVFDALVLVKALVLVVRHGKAARRLNLSPKDRSALKPEDENAEAQCVGFQVHHLDAEAVNVLMDRFDWSDAAPDAGESIICNVAIPTDEEKLFDVGDAGDVVGPLGTETTAGRCGLEYFLCSEDVFKLPLVQKGRKTYTPSPLESTQQEEMESVLAPVFSSGAAKCF